MLEVRRAELASRKGAGPAECRGGVEIASVILTTARLREVRDLVGARPA